MNINLGKFNSSMNFAFGIFDKADDWDPFNNPYIEFVAYKMMSGESLMADPEDFSLRLCQRDELLKFLTPRKLLWYPKAICIEKRDKLFFRGSWFFEEYEMPTIGIVRCQNTTTRTCANDTEISQWLIDHPAFFIH